MKGYLQSLPVVGKFFLDVQSEEVWAFWRFMQDHFRTSVINNNSALEMQLVARTLEALGIQSKDRFLKNFMTTIRTSSWRTGARAPRPRRRPPPRC